MTVGFIFTLVVAGLILGYVLTRYRRILRKMRQAPIRLIRDVKDGPARIAGKLGYVLPPLVAPLTGRRCAYFEVLVEQQGNKGHWRTLVQTTGGQDFSLRDESGQALVHLDSTMVAVVLDAHFRSGFGNDASPELEAFLSAHGTSSEGLVFNRTLRYREGVLEEGEMVSALGFARWEVDPEPSASSQIGGYRDAPMRLVVSSEGETKLHVSDDPSVMR